MLFSLENGMHLIQSIKYLRLNSIIPKKYFIQFIDLNHHLLFYFLNQLISIKLNPSLKKKNMYMISFVSIVI